ncbi:MAG TPA: hypothetical protein VFN50_10600 [Acidimicrobiales bacterium]|nr:hypothetical protein [Acidimicrobiales bacterium]
MTSLTLRQFRTQGVVAASGLALLAALVLATGPHLASLYAQTLRACSAHGDCGQQLSFFSRDDTTLRNWLDAVVIAVPGLIGIFWGAPLVARELESGTYRLAWTQSVTRTRWVAVKLAVVSLAAMAVAGLTSLAVSWWASPLDAASQNVFGSFDSRGIVPIGYGAFAFCLGVAGGVVIRRSLPAMATVLAGFTGIRLGVDELVRPYLLSPVGARSPLSVASVGYGSFNGSPFQLFAQPATPPDAWVLRTGIVDAGGQTLTGAQLRQACPQLHTAPPGGGGSGVTTAPGGVAHTLSHCIATLSAAYHEVVAYQPAGRYWPMQWAELGIYLAGAVALGAGAWWWVRRRLT